MEQGACSVLAQAMWLGGRSSTPHFLCMSRYCKCRGRCGGANERLAAEAALGDVDCLFSRGLVPLKWAQPFLPPHLDALSLNRFGGNSFATWSSSCFFIDGSGGPWVGHGPIARCGLTFTGIAWASRPDFLQLIGVLDEKLDNALIGVSFQNGSMRPVA